MRTVVALLIVLLVGSAPVAAQDGAGAKPADYDALIAAADAKLAAKQFDAAMRLYAAAARQRTDSARPLVGIARCVFEKSAATNDPRGVPQAKVLLREARIRDAEWGGSWFFWGELSLAVRDHANAVNGFRGALQKNYRAKEARPLLARSLLWLGADEARAGALAKAVGTLSEARRIFALLAKDETASQAERGEAERLRRKAVSNLAAVYQRGRDLATAETLLRELVAADPKSRDYRFNLGLLLSAAGKNEAAEAEFRKSVQLNADPEWVDAHRPLGHLASVAGLVEAADEHLRKYTTKRPEDPEGWRTLGDHLLRHAKPEEAAGAYFRCLELVPGHAPAMGNLVQALADAGREAEAAKWGRLLEVLRRERSGR